MKIVILALILNFAPFASAQTTGASGYTGVKFTVTNISSVTTDGTSLIVGDAQGNTYTISPLGNGQGVTVPIGTFPPLAPVIKSCQTFALLAMSNQAKYSITIWASAKTPTGNNTYIVFNVASCGLQLNTP